MPSDTVDVREAAKLPTPGNAEAIVIVLPCGSAPLPADYEASIKIDELARSAMIAFPSTSL